ncbi:MAG TPA: phosphate ABC transporter permease subunit PstC [Thermoplasmata archaeon]|nr:phosphate ABC transporter permease subunit PstC [Thermoplasmata archaeon]
MADGREPTRRRGAALIDNLFHSLTALSALGILALLAAFIIVLFQASKASLVRFGPGFVIGPHWDPTHQIFGALPFVYGTLLTSAIGLLIAVPISLFIAIFVSELAPRWIANAIGYVIELLAAVPSVVFGLWGIAVLVPFMAGTVEPRLAPLNSVLPIFSGPHIGLDVLTAGVILAIMIIPTISAISREALRAVPTSQREAALSLGATRWEATRISVLSYARIGIIAAIILGLGRAVGETMAVTMTIGNRDAIPTSLFSQGQSIASLIANEFFSASPGSLEIGSIIEAALVLLLITLIINVFAQILISRLLRRTGGPIE